MTTYLFGNAKLVYECIKCQSGLTKEHWHDRGQWEKFALIQNNIVGYSSFQQRKPFYLRWPRRLAMLLVWSSKKGFKSATRRHHKNGMMVEPAFCFYGISSNVHIKHRSKGIDYVDVLENQSILWTKETILFLASIRKTAHLYIPQSWRLTGFRNMVKAYWNDLLSLPIFARDRSLRNTRTSRLRKQRSVTTPNKVS